MTFKRKRIISFVKKLLLIISILFLSAFPFKVKAQKNAELRKIKIEKSEGNLYFYQKGTVSDSISSGDHDLFYIIVTGKKKCDTKIEVENGIFKKTKNDSVYQLVRMPGMKYVHLFSDTTSVITDKKETEACEAFMSYVNGVSAYENSHDIFIVISCRKNKEAVLENLYYFK